LANRAAKVVTTMMRLFVARDATGAASSAVVVREIFSLVTPKVMNRAAKSACHQHCLASAKRHRNAEPTWQPGAATTNAEERSVQTAWLLKAVTLWAAILAGVVVVCTVLARDASATPQQRLAPYQHSAVLP
jgi:hypothetical protein